MSTDATTAVAALARSVRALPFQIFSETPAAQQELIRSFMVIARQCSVLRRSSDDRTVRVSDVCARSKYAVFAVLSPHSEICKPVSAALESVLPEIQVVCALFGVDKHEYVAAANALAFETVQFEESAKFITCAKRMVKTFTLPVPFVMSVHNSADVLSIDCYHRILHFGRADAPWAAGPLLPLCDATAGHVWRGDALVLMAEHAGAPSRSTVAIMNACAAELDPDRVRVYMACRPTGASARIRAAAPGVADELPRLLFVPAGRVDRAVAMDDPDFSVSSIRAFVSRLRTPDGT